MDYRHIYREPAFSLVYDQLWRYANTHYILLNVLLTINKSNPVSYCNQPLVCYLFFVIIEYPWVPVVIVRVLESLRVVHDDDDTETADTANTIKLVNIAWHFHWVKFSLSGLESVFSLSYFRFIAWARHHSIV